MLNLRTFQAIASYAKRRLRTLPKWPYLLAGALLVLLGQAIQSMGGLPALYEVAWGIVRDLASIQAFSFVPHYFANLTACDFHDAYGEQYWSCSEFRYVNPIRYIVALVTTAGDIWSTSGWAGRLILPAAMLIGFIASVGLVLKAQGVVSNSSAGEANLLTFVGAALLTPLVASIVALVLQIMAMLLFVVFGAAVGLLLAIAGAIAIPLKLLKLAKSVEDAGKGLQEAVKVAAVTATDPKDGPKA